MKIMFIVYHDIHTEARTQEMLECAKKLGSELGGEAIFVSYSKPLKNNKANSILTSNGKRRYFDFIKDAINAIKKEKPNIVILHDNYTSAILRWIHKHMRDIYVIYDSSELYIDGKPKTFKQLVAMHMRYFEKKYLKFANVVIAANIERAVIMKKYFQLKEVPIVFDNMHRIDNNCNVIECDKKYGNLFTKRCFYIVCGGGISKKRMMFEVAKAVGNLGNNYKLIIAGSATPKDREDFDVMLKRNKFSNIFYLGFISRNEWKYILNKGHISVVTFSQDLINNINCASGKMYESLFEGKPILTSTNPPLKRICNEYNVGVSTDNFFDGILKLEKNYDEYCKNVKTYINMLNYDKKVDLLTEKLKKKIETDMFQGKNK